MRMKEEEKIRKRISGMRDAKDYIPTNEIIGLISEERLRCAALVCTGCVDQRGTVVVDGDWLHPYDGGKHYIPCEAQAIRDPQIGHEGNAK